MASTRASGYFLSGEQEGLATFQRGELMLGADEVETSVPWATLSHHVMRESQPSEALLLA